MIKNRRAVVVSVAGILLALSSFAGAVVLPAVYDSCDDFGCTQKPDGDKWKPKGDCNHLPCEARPIHIMGGLGSRASAISKSIEDGKFDQASAGLEKIFSGGNRQTGAGPHAVIVGAGSKLRSSEGNVKLHPASKKWIMSAFKSVPTPPIQIAACGEPSGCESRIGKEIEPVIKDITTPIEHYIENHDYTRDAIDQYGGCRMKGTCDK